MTTITLPRAVVEQALEALTPWMDSDHTVQHAAYHALRAALAQQAEPVQEQDVELSAALGWPGGISNPVLDRKTLLQQVAALRDALAQQAEPVLQTCNCRWDGEVQVQQCTLHEAHVDAIHEWAERAKVAERKLAQQAEPVEPVAAERERCAEYLMQQAAECRENSPTRVTLESCAAVLRLGLVEWVAQQAEPVPAWKPWKPVEWGRGCQACGIGADGKAYGYVCPRSDCPTRVTCGGVV